jgi:hypothetical protein
LQLFLSLYPTKVFRQQFWFHRKHSQQPISLPLMLSPMACSVPIAVELLLMSGWIWDVNGVAFPWQQRQVF